MKKSVFVSLVLLFVFSLSVLIFCWSFVQCALAFVHCYLTWPIFRPRHVHVDFASLNSSSSSSSPQVRVRGEDGGGRIPRRLHHIVLGPLSRSVPLNWQRARNACIVLHPNFDQFFFWSDENSEAFLQTNYPWFVPTWKSYETFVQKADSLRYFVLFHYGGIFLDMDLSCRVSLNPLLNYLESSSSLSSSPDLFFGVKAFPVGISNGFLISTRAHPFLRRVMDNLASYHRTFLFPHATIVISTGPMYLSIQMQLHLSLRDSILVLDGEENMLGGARRTPLFDHFGSGSWHQADETFFKHIPLQLQQQSTTISLSIVFLPLVVLSSFLLVRSSRWRRSRASAT